KHYSELPQPQGDAALAVAFSAQGDGVSAAIYNQRIYYGFPASAEAATAETEMTRLRGQLGNSYPPALGSAMLDRAMKLLNASQPAKAKLELESLLPTLGGADHDLAQVRIGVADYNLNKTAAAQKYLSALTVSAPEADAERLHYLVQTARRVENREEMNRRLEELAHLYPDSIWRMQ